MRRHPWPAVIAVLSLVLTVVVWVVEPDDSAAQAADPFTIDVSKTTDLVSGEAIQIDVSLTGPDTTFQGSPLSEVRLCQWDESYTAEEFGNDSGGTECIQPGLSISDVDTSLDSEFLHLFPGNQRAVTSVRPGVGTKSWQIRPSFEEHEITCGPEDRCRLAFKLDLVVGGNLQTVIHAGDELQFRPEQGVAGCAGTSADVVHSTMPDRLQNAWLSWTREVCQTTGDPPPTTAFFQPEGNGLSSFASGEADVTYSAVGYGPGFEPATRRPMVPTPIGLNAVVVAVGGGYLLQSATWPPDYPRAHEEFRLTTDQLAILFGQWELGLVFDHAPEVLANNPQIPDAQYIRNSNVSAALALTGPQSTTLFASTYLDTLAPNLWTNVAGVPRGVETDFNRATPAHQAGELDLKTGRPDLARIVYRELFNQGTYYVLTDLATANALGLTVVTIPNAAGEWVTPTPETLAAAVPQMQRQDDGTLVPNPNATAGYPLTYVEYAMAPAAPLVDASCAPRTGSQRLLEDWLSYLTTEGQGQLSVAEGGLVPLTADLQGEAASALGQVGATTATCVSPPTTGPPTTTPPTSGPGGGGFGSGSPPGGGGRFPGGSSLGGGTVNGGTANGATRPATADTAADALQAAEDDGVDLPDLHGIRHINDLLPPIALLAIVAMTTVVALATAGYPVPVGVRRASRRVGSAAARGARGVRRVGRTPRRGRATAT